jgi:hypothetical protein
MIRRAVERLAWIACVATKEPQYPRRSLIAPGLFRILGALISALGGRLESRLIVFSSADGLSDPKIERVVSNLGEALSRAGLSPRIDKRVVSRAEGLASDDMRDFVKEDTHSILFVQVFVLMHQYWAGVPVTQEVVRQADENPEQA